MNVNYEWKEGLYTWPFFGFAWNTKPLKCAIKKGSEGETFFWNIVKQAEMAFAVFPRGLLILPSADEAKTPTRNSLVELKNGIDPGSHCGCWWKNSRLAVSKLKLCAGVDRARPLFFVEAINLKIQEKVKSSPSLLRFCGLLSLKSEPVFRTIFPLRGLDGNVLRITYYV